MNWGFESEKTVSGYGAFEVGWQRLRDAPTWLLTIRTGIDHGHGAGGHIRSCYPQATAVMDDFGTLVCVTDWH